MNERAVLTTEARGINVPRVPALAACGSCRYASPAGGIYNGDESRRS